MPNREANEALVCRLVAALQQRDIAGLGAVLADDVVYHFPGRSAMAGTYRGRGEVLGFFRSFGKLLGSPPAVSTHDILSTDEHVVELAVRSAERGGTPFEWRAIRIYHVGKAAIAEIWVPGGPPRARRLPGLREGTTA